MERSQAFWVIGISILAILAGAWIVGGLIALGEALIGIGAFTAFVFLLIATYNI